CLDMLFEDRSRVFDSAEVGEELTGMQALLAGDRISAADELTRGILRDSGSSGSAMNRDAEEFNRTAERYYRTTLWSGHMKEGLQVLMDDGKRLDSCSDQYFAQMRQEVAGNKGAAEVIQQLGNKVIADQADSDDTRRLIMLSMLIVEQEHRQSMTQSYTGTQ
ncbi:MAG: hypothetical protein KKA76_01435, partial [Proteobacteria bacterium]|nr:hypothetical protein [Pseudomonadota bacterium]